MPERPLPRDAGLPAEPLPSVAWSPEANTESSGPDRPGLVQETRLEEAGLALKQLQWRHHREANRRLAGVGLSYVQWDVLRHLAKQPDASLHALAELTFQTDQSMGALARRMIDRGLLERMDSPGRAVRHQLTPAGQEARDAGGRVMAGVLGSTLGQLSGTELTALLRLLHQAAS